MSTVNLIDQNKKKRATVVRPSSGLRNYLSLGLLFVPAFGFAALYAINYDNPRLGLTSTLPFLPWQFCIVAIAGFIATCGGVADWRYHRIQLEMKMSEKERIAEAVALGIGGVPMFGMMWFATLSDDPNWYLIPIIGLLIFIVVAISYDEFVFHRRRCESKETFFHRLLVFGNGTAWLAWFSFIYV